MFPKFFEAVGESLGKGTGEDLVSRLFGPATLFWGIGLLIYLWAWGWPDLNQLDTVTQLIWIAVGLIVILMSDVVMGWFTLPILRLLEGYHWPGFLEKRGISRWRKRIDQKNRSWQELRKLARLAQKNPTELTEEEKKALNKAQQEQPNWMRRQVQLDMELAAYPTRKEHLMPTHLGNLLKAAEQHSNERYGLEAIIMWPRLWLVLPENTQKELSAARLELDHAIQLISWGILLVIWTPIMFWLKPVTPVFSMTFLINLLAYLLPVLAAVIIILVGYQWRTVPAASLYGNLIRSAFDLYRFELYEQMNWPLPVKNNEEQQQGEELTRYIFRGYTKFAITFERQKD